MSLNLKAEQRSILNTFKTDDQYIIPPYQRAYSWTYELCSIMYDDILNAYDKQEEYFLGAIITSSVDTNKNKLMVIDGQQRLTTILLLIKVFSLFESLKPLKDILEKENWQTGDAEDRIVSLVFESNDAQELKDVLRMSKEDFEEQYSLCLMKKGQHKGRFSEKNCKNKFITNSMYFYDWIKFYNVNNNDLKELIFFFLANIVILPIELSGKNEQEAKEKALKIFETMNNRGLSLNDTDIFKAYLYDKAERIQEEEVFKSSWADLKNSCELLNIETIDLFRYYFHIVRGKNKKTSSEINLREFFTREDYSPLILENYKSVLNDLTMILDALHFIEKEKHSNSELTQWLQLIEIYTNQYPKIVLIVYIFNAQKNSNLDKKNLLKFLKNIIRFSYYQGSTTRIKYEIYNMIKLISYNEKIQEYIEEEAIVDDFMYLGMLKNGYTLLCHYLQKEEALKVIKVDKILKVKNKLNYHSTWNNIDIKTIENRLGNLIISDLSNEITVTQWSYQDFEQRDTKLRSIIVDFFQGKI